MSPQTQRHCLNFDMCAELAILEAKRSEMRLEEVVNGTDGELTLHCEGASKSQPQWKHNGVVVKTTSDTVLEIEEHSPVRGRKTVIMTRQNATERFDGRYQCVDAAFFQSDSDIFTIHAGCITYQGKHNLI